MLHVKIVSAADKTVLGYEHGTRAQFDARWGGNPQWVFFEQRDVGSKNKLSDFLKNPQTYLIDDKGFLKKSSQV